MIKLSEKADSKFDVWFAKDVREYLEETSAKLAGLRTQTPDETLAIVAKMFRLDCEGGRHDRRYSSKDLDRDSSRTFVLSASSGLLPRQEEAEGRA